MTEELDTLRGTCQPGLVFWGSGVFSFVESVEAESVRVSIKKRVSHQLRHRRRGNHRPVASSKSERPFCAAGTGRTRGLFFGGPEEPSGGRRARPARGADARAQASRSASHAGFLKVTAQDRPRRDCSALKTRPRLCPQTKTKTALETDCGPAGQWLGRAGVWPTCPDPAQAWTP